MAFIILETKRGKSVLGNKYARSSKSDTKRVMAFLKAGNPSGKYRIATVDMRLKAEVYRKYPTLEYIG